MYYVTKNNPSVYPKKVNLWKLIYRLLMQPFPCLYRSTHRRCSVKFRKIKKKAPVPETLFYIKLLVNFVKFLKTHFLKNISGRLLLSIWYKRTFN